jgi:hypothetical protein
LRGRILRRCWVSRPISRSTAWSVAACTLGILGGVAGLAQLRQNPVSATVRFYSCVDLSGGAVARAGPPAFRGQNGLEGAIEPPTCEGRSQRLLAAFHGWLVKLARIGRQPLPANSDRRLPMPWPAIVLVFRTISVLVTVAFGWRTHSLALGDDGDPGCDSGPFPPIAPSRATPTVLPTPSLRTFQGFPQLHPAHQGIGDVRGNPIFLALTEINLMGPVGLTGALSGVGVVRRSDPEFYVPARGAARALASLHSPLPAGAPLRSRRPTPTAERSFSIR